MTRQGNSGRQRHLDWIVPGATRDSWLVPSALLSSRWSQDTQLTPDPTGLYTGEIVGRVSLEDLQQLLEAFGETRTDLEVTGGSLGVLTWNVTYRRGVDSFLLTIPLAVDSAPAGQRSRASVPEAGFRNAEDYIARGLSRYLLPPRELVPLDGGLVGAVFSVPSGYRPLSFCLGRVRIDLQDEEGDWVVPLGEQASAEVLSELVAAFVYHYDPEEEGGTALSDVFVNDGDFLVRRRSDGTFQLRLSVARYRQAGIPPHRFLLQLMQLVAYEDWTIGEDLRGLPVLMSHPSIVLAGLTRGLRARYEDLGLGDQQAREAAERWMTTFARSPEGRGYRPWVERFLSSDLPLTLDQDPRTCWWNLTELREKRDLLQLRPRAGRAVTARAEELSSAVDILSHRLQRAQTEDDGAQISVNDLDRTGVLELLGGQRKDADPLVSSWFRGWPYRRREDLPPGVLSALSERTSSRLSFRNPLVAEEDGQLQCLSRAQATPLSVPLANPEVFAAFAFPPALHPVAAESFPSFERYMDDALHHPEFGYYRRQVSIGRSGHFSTHPEDLTPHYGAWIATLICNLYAEMLENGVATPAREFPIVEFGAGTGRLARDIIDAISARAGREASDSIWTALRANLRYHIFELSDALRVEQRALLGPDAKISPGDARCPERCLERGFPNGIRGIILSNELPDAFGVHKVVLSAQGNPSAIVVVPRIEAQALTDLPSDLAGRVAGVDLELRRTFGWSRHPKDRFLDLTTYRYVMTAIHQRDAEIRDKLLDGVWFEEGLVDAKTFEDLARSLESDSAELAQALAEADCGAVIYVNLHAESFVRSVASQLRAGCLLTIDYGHSMRETLNAARERLFPFRVYRDEGRFAPRPNDPYARPGTQDLTADVNFTSLARAGVDAGLSLLHFGLERDIAHEDLPRLLSSSMSPSLEKFLGNSVFKILALGAHWPEPGSPRIGSRGANTQSPGARQTFGQNFTSLPLFSAAPTDERLPSR